MSFILGSILKHQEDLFAAELHRLKQQPLFSLVDFENLIDRIRSTVAEVSSRTTALLSSTALKVTKFKSHNLFDLQHLWTLMVEESDLLEQLKVCINHTWLCIINQCQMSSIDACVSSQIIKDFYLLGRGELYQVFIDLAQHMLKTPPTAVTEHGRY